MLSELGRALASKAVLEAISTKSQTMGSSRYAIVYYLDHIISRIPPYVDPFGFEFFSDAPHSRYTPARSLSSHLCGVERVEERRCWKTTEAKSLRSGGIEELCGGLVRFILSVALSNLSGCIVLIQFFLVSVARGLTYGYVEDAKRSVREIRADLYCELIAVS